MAKMRLFLRGYLRSREGGEGEVDMDVWMEDPPHHHRIGYSM